MFVLGVPSLLNPNIPGVINCVKYPVVVNTSAITPDPGSGSVPIDLEASDVLEVLSV
jgi:hypothetical protein